MITFILSFYGSCFNISANSERTSIYVSYKENEANNIYTDVVKDGKAEIVTKEGYVIDVEGAIPDGLSLVIMPILETDTEAMKWFRSCMSSYGANFFPFELYFVDKNGTRISPQCEINVRINIGNDSRELIVCYLSYDSVVTDLDSFIKNKEIHFSTSKDGYFVIAEKHAENQTPGQPGESQVPNTGDAHTLSLWYILVIVSSIGLCAFKYQKRANLNYHK